MSRWLNFLNRGTAGAVQEVGIPQLFAAAAWCGMMLGHQRCSAPGTHLEHMVPQQLAATAWPDYNFPWPSLHRHDAPRVPTYARTPIPSAYLHAWQPSMTHLCFACSQQSCLQEVRLPDLENGNKTPS